MPTKHVAKAMRADENALIGRDLLRLADQLGFEHEGLFRSAGLSAARWRSGSIDRLQLSQLFEEIVLRAEQSSCERLHRGPPLPRDGFRVMCLALLACPSLKEVVEVSARFFAIFTQGAVEVALTIHGRQARFRMNSLSVERDSLSNLLVTLAGLHAFAQIFSWLVDTSLDISDISVRHSGQLSLVPVAGFMNAPIRMGHCDNGFAFDARILERKIVRTYDEFEELAQFFPFDLRPPQYDGWLLAERVKAYYLSGLQRGRSPTLDQIASAFSLSPSTLRRRLAEEGRPLQGIKDLARAEIAKTMLRDMPATLAQIAERLSFSDVANFRRTFQRWTGMTPTAFRKEAAGRLSGAVHLQSDIASKNLFLNKNDLDGEAERLTTSTR